MRTEPQARNSLRREGNAILRRRPLNGLGDLSAEHTDQSQQTE
jgi:hypothetical protein